MPSEQPELLLAVQELRDTVASLVVTLRNDYPKRIEIRRDRFRFAVYVLVGLVVSAVIGGLMTIVTVSGCFLSRTAIEGHANAVCGIMPGYTTAQERNARTTERFMQLLQDIEKNKRQIRQLQHKVADGKVQPKKG